jgi:cellulose synthase (UDP-forming)
LASDWSVDVFVPTYNEPLEVLEATLTGCNAITYPHTTYVLDDGHRKEVQALAALLGCAYLTRLDNRHAKAGNINAALASTTGEFIVVLDADTVPQPDYLDKTLGYFVDKNVALVQLPQEFYNLDSIQHRGGRSTTNAWHEQVLFYRVIQPAKNRSNSAFWCGSPSVVRRFALESVGGVATDSITEDIHTTLRLHGHGWRTVNHNLALAYGIAPQTLQAFCVQRLRWAQGTMQILRSPENPLIAKGLSVSQRLNYVGSMFTYFEAVQKLILLSVPPLVLLTGQLPIHATAGDFLVHWAPFFFLSALANIALGRGSYRWLAVEQYNVLKMFVFIWASSVLVWPRQLAFIVTPKSANASVYGAEKRALTAQFAALSFVLLATLVGCVNLVRGAAGGPGRDIVLITIVWALANAALLGSGVWIVLQRVYHRADYRFPMQLGVRLGRSDGTGISGISLDFSRQGLAMLSHSPVKRGTAMQVDVALPNGKWRALAVVQHSRPTRGGYRVGVTFGELSNEQRSRLFAFLFVTAARHQQIKSHGSLVDVLAEQGPSQTVVAAA